MGDDYPLFLSLGETLPFFKRVVVIYHMSHDPTDLTLDVLHYYCERFPQTLHVIPTEIFNWAGPRQDCLVSNHNFNDVSILRRNIKIDICSFWMQMTYC